MISFGDFKKDEITELISNKDPLGLNSDIESYTTIKSKGAILSEEDKTNMAYDAIPHYLKAVNLNNSADTS